MNQRKAATKSASLKPNGISHFIETTWPQSLRLPTPGRTQSFKVIYCNLGDAALSRRSCCQQSRLLLALCTHSTFLLFPSSPTLSLHPRPLRHPPPTFYLPTSRAPHPPPATLHSSTSAHSPPSLLPLPRPPPPTH